MQQNVYGGEVRLRGRGQEGGALFCLFTSMFCHFVWVFKGVDLMGMILRSQGKRGDGEMRGEDCVVTFY